eukprot:148738-Hanusia_phi.AAC.2
MEGGRERGGGKAGPEQGAEAGRCGKAREEEEQGKGEERGEEGKQEGGRGTFDSREGLWIANKDASLLVLPDLIPLDQHKASALDANPLGAVARDLVLLQQAS